MAAMQQSAINKVEEKYLETINNMMKEAVSDLAQYAQTNSQSQGVTKVSIQNKTPGEEICFLRFHNWSGRMTDDRYPLISKGCTGKFTHKGTLPGGSKGAVVYYGSTVEGGQQPNSAWLMAWHVSDDTAENKVYLEAGDIHRYTPREFDWDIIESKLDASHNNLWFMNYSNGCKATARIGDGNVAALAAVFDWESV